jgi:hypothetical protein
MGERLVITAFLFDASSQGELDEIEERSAREYNPFSGYGSRQ